MNQRAYVHLYRTGAQVPHVGPQSYDRLAYGGHPRIVRSARTASGTFTAYWRDVPVGHLLIYRMAFDVQAMNLDVCSRSRAGWRQNDVSLRPTENDSSWALRVASQYMGISNALIRSNSERALPSTWSFVTKNVLDASVSPTREGKALSYILGFSAHGWKGI